MPGIKVITDLETKDVTLLEDADVQFVSLVKHGANRMPFRVIKNEKGGEQMALVIQSILLPEGVGLQTLATEGGLEYLSDAKTDVVQKFDDYSKYTQIDVTKFEPESMRLVKLGDKGFALAGKLVDGLSDNVLTLGKKDVDKIAMLPTPPMEALIGTDGTAIAQSAIAVSFRDIFERELSSMLDVVYGSLRQSANDPKKRKSAIVNAVDAFKSFLTVSLDALGSAATKMEKPVIAQQGKDGKLKVEGGLDAMFETKDEFVAAVAEVVDAKLVAAKEAADKEVGDAKAAADKVTADAAAAAAKKEQEGNDKDKTNTNKSDTTDTNKAESDTPKWATDLVTSVKALTEKVEKLEENDGNQLETDPNADDVEKGAGVEKGKKAEPEKKSVFSGLLTK